MTSLSSTGRGGLGKEEAVRDTALRLLTYCRSRKWAGYDPYDALNSRLFKALRFLNFRLARLALTQLNKRSPMNVRRLLLVPPTQNPKALGLFLSALVRLSKSGVAVTDEEVVYLVERIAQLRAPHPKHWCWGYSFPWQTRTVLVPEGSPNLVCTCFVGNALLDLFDHWPQDAYLEMAVSAADFILNELYYTEGPKVASFHYPLTGNRAKVHNANLLAGAFLCRVSSYSGESRFLEPARQAAIYSAGRQQPDGSWVYGELPTQQWIDNFHTGFNLCALRDIEIYAETDEFKGVLERGAKFYRESFFEADGGPKYFHNRTYPFDVHSAAQGMITLAELADLDSGHLDLAWKVCRWSSENLLDEEGYFYSQKRAWFTNRIPYMRWGQAWMLLALSSMLGTAVKTKSVPANAMS
jgi:hypothetical protein